MSQAQARQKQVELPGQNLTLEETLRVMDVAREMRDQREKAEEMFRRDDIRVALREKLLRSARLSGDTVTEQEIDAAAMTMYVWYKRFDGDLQGSATVGGTTDQIVAGALIKF